MEVTLFQPSYTENGRQKQSKTWNARFKDHMGRRQTIALSRRKDDAERHARRIDKLVRRRIDEKDGRLDEELSRWIDELPPKIHHRLTEMGLIQSAGASATTPLVDLLENGVVQPDGKAESSFKQSMEAKGVTAAQVHDTVKRIRRVLDGCGFATWTDLQRPSAADDVAVYLNGLRKAEEIVGQTANYMIRDVKRFCRWLANRLKKSVVPLSGLEPLDNVAIDREERRALSADEMRWMLAAAGRGGMIQGLTGEQRQFLYQFAFTTGMRPGQMRTLKVKDFHLEDDPPTVTTPAKDTKGRRPYEQVLTKEFAAELRQRFEHKLPEAGAILMPSKYHMADMFRRDLAAARQAWIDDAGDDHKERAKRLRSDFLLDEDHNGAKAVFYSLRHGHGSALAAAGVPAVTIAKSMHHKSRTTTERYLHADRKQVAGAIAKLPSILPVELKPTGTTGAEKPCANLAQQDGRNPRSDGQNHPSGVESQTVESALKTAISGVFQGNLTDRPLGGIGRRDGFKIHFPKGVSVRLR